jgi:hypothetical protein
MNWKLATSALVLGSLFLVVPGCAADASSDPADDEEAAATEDELNATASKLVGAFHGDGNVHPPTFEGLIFQSGGTFLADVDTGIRCVRAPCPSHVRFSGKFSATKNYLRLSPAPGKTAEQYHGRYRYNLSGTKLSLSRADLGPGWSQSFAKEASYCREASDCGSQGLIHPMCLGQWTCGDNASNACAYKCGMPVPQPVWPSSATKLVAQSSSGFAPPPPPGSNCQIGRQKFTLDVGTRQLAWETCERASAGAPLLMVSGAKKITTADLAAINAAMNAVTITTADICGADKPMMHLEVTTPAGAITYTDSFYSCQGNGPYVDNIGGAFGALRDAAF